MRVLAVSAAVVAGLLAGCGSGTSTPTLARGRQIFASQCAGCHTLTGHERGAIGGDLLLAHLKEQDLASFARVMPTKPALLSEDARAVASYIVSVASRSGLEQAQP